MIWKKFDNTYEVSDAGLIRNFHTGHIKKPRVTKDGYSDVKFGNGKRYLVHRLVAMTYLPNPDNKPQVNHLDCDKLNNRLNNLEWSTPKENVSHAYSNNRLPSVAGEDNPRCNITEDTALLIYCMIETGVSSVKIAKELNVTYHTVTNIKQGKAWKWLQALKL